jgi:hypothetical protein
MVATNGDMRQSDATEGHNCAAGGRIADTVWGNHGPGHIATARTEPTCGSRFSAFPADVLLAPFHEATQALRRWHNDDLGPVAVRDQPGGVNPNHDLS